MVRLLDKSRQTILRASTHTFSYSPVEARLLVCLPSTDGRKETSPSSGSFWCDYRTKFGAIRREMWGCRDEMGLGLQSWVGKVGQACKVG